MRTKIALVTGASAGIGEAIARALLDEGWTVYAAARRVDRMAGLADRGAHVLGMDVTDDASMTAGVQRILDECGRIDALVNNAGYGSYGALEEVPMDEARRQFEVNVFGLARLTQLVTPTMRAQHSGRIVNISSTRALMSEPETFAYAAAKGGLDAFTHAMAVSLGPRIRVNSIRPGWIETGPWQKSADRDAPKHSKRDREQHLLGAHHVSPGDRATRLGGAAGGAAGDARDHVLAGLGRAAQRHGERRAHGSHGRDVRRVLRDRAPAHVLRCGQLEPEVPSLDERVGRDDRAAVGRGDDRRVVARSDRDPGIRTYTAGGQRDHAVLPQLRHGAHAGLRRAVRLL